MKVEVGEHGLIEMKEVYNPIIFDSNDGERLSVCMRDSGFALMYEGKPYWAQKGEITGLEDYTVLDHLIAAKQEIEKGNSKEDLNSLSFLEEAIKWQQTKQL